MDYLERYHIWLQDPLLSPGEREELILLQNDHNELRERFYEDIQFGTAGLRGILGAGSNRMNLYNVKRATQALCATIRSKEQGVVIAYDSRHMSDVFAKTAALVLCANGIRTYLFPALRPVPELSYAVRALQCEAGIEITASHNPSQYNGYKVYAAYGGQLAPDACAQVMKGMQAVRSMADVAIMEEDEAVAAGLLHILDGRVDDQFLADIKTLRLHPEAVQANAAMPIVYTPLYGAGSTLVPRLLKECGFENICIVEEQALPNGDFPTVKTPNPEEEAALQLALELARQVNAQVVIATDPDADRIACAVPTAQGYYKFNGNQMGALLLHYILSSRKENGALPKDGLVVRSIVSSTLTDRIAEAYGLTVTEVLTGFRFISEQIAQAQEQGRPFLFAFEESYGYLAGDFSRDKDAVSAAMLICEAAAYYAAQHKTLYDVLQELYQTYGYHQELSLSIPFAGMAGQADMRALITQIRALPPKQLGGLQVLAVRDYLQGTRNGEKVLTLPVSDVLYYELEGGSWACLRPSGTEPKLKAYIAACGSTEALCRQTAQAILADVQILLKK